MTKKILVIDDEDDIRASIKTIMEKEGFSVSEAFNGKNALNMIKKDKFDFIILDVMMPEMSGWDVLENIMKSNPEYKNKILFLSVVVIPEDRRKEIISKGAFGYMTKPFDIKTLVNKVKEALK